MSESRFFSPSFNCVASFSGECTTRWFVFTELFWRGKRLHLSVRQISCVLRSQERQWKEINELYSWKQGLSGMGGPKLREFSLLCNYIWVPREDKSGRGAPGTSLQFPGAQEPPRRQPLGPVSTLDWLRALTSLFSSPGRRVSGDRSTLALLLFISHAPVAGGLFSWLTTG